LAWENVSIPDQIGFTAGLIWSYGHVSYSCEESNEQGVATAKLEMQSFGAGQFLIVTFIWFHAAKV
jgi:hypothetical protein